MIKSIILRNLKNLYDTTICKRSQYKKADLVLKIQKMLNSTK